MSTRKKSKPSTVVDTARAVDDDHRVANTNGAPLDARDRDLISWLVREEIARWRAKQSAA